MTRNLFGSEGGFQYHIVTLFWNLATSWHGDCGYPIWANAKARDKRTENHEKKGRREMEISRRQFFKGLGATVGMFGFQGLLTSDVAHFLPPRRWARAQAWD